MSEEPKLRTAREFVVQLNLKDHCDYADVQEVIDEASAFARHQALTEAITVATQCDAYTTAGRLLKLRDTTKD
jgi:hypothetical protein